MRNAIIFFILSIFFISCLKDREFDLTPSTADKEITQGSVLVNEICASGSTYTSEFGGTPPDWIEIYNPSTDTFVMEQGKWFTTDALSFPYKFALPQIKIPPHKFFVICCDSQDSIASQVHTNFSLSSGGEDIGIFYKTDAGPYLQVDQHTFGSQSSGVSIGRIPDGSANWNNCSLMTPGTPNQ